MPAQPNYCTECGKLIPYSEAAYYCSEECYLREKKREFKEVLSDGILDLNLSLDQMKQDIKDLIQDIREILE